nr:hypothetical protein [Pseudochrobactrum asaccharolyticum]
MPHRAAVTAGCGWQCRSVAPPDRALVPSGNGTFPCPLLSGNPP